MSAMPAIVHKIHDNSNALDTGRGDGFSELQLESIAEALAGVRLDMRAEMEAAIAKAVAALRDETDVTETVAELRGQVRVLLNLAGANGNGSNMKLFEATEKQVVRKMKISARVPKRRMPKIINPRS
jgi:hypothetical protein